MNSPRYIVHLRNQMTQQSSNGDCGLLWQTMKCQTSTTLEVSVSTSLEVLEAEVMQLVPADRSHLLERLIASLDSDPEVEEAWEREADRRESELESGLIDAVAGDAAIARLRSRLPR